MREEKVKHISTNSFEKYPPITIFFNIEAANSALFIFKVTVAENGKTLKGIDVEKSGQRSRFLSRAILILKVFKTANKRLHNLFIIPWCVAQYIKMRSRNQVYKDSWDSESTSRQRGCSTKALRFMCARDAPFFVPAPPDPPPSITSCPNICFMLSFREGKRKMTFKSTCVFCRTVVEGKEGGRWRHVREFIPAQEISPFVGIQSVSSACYGRVGRDYSSCQDEGRPFLFNDLRDNFI